MKNHFVASATIVATILTGGIFYYSQATPSDPYERFEEKLAMEMYFNENPSASVIESVKPNTATPTNGHKKFIVPIMDYHGIRQTGPSESAAVKQYNVAPVTLALQLAYLQANGYTAITTADLAWRFKNNLPLPEKPVLLTFDDGWRSQFVEAFPILKQFKMPATFYIFTNPIDKSKRFMTWENIKELDAAGMEIGSHSVTHPFLTRVSEKAARWELEISKKAIEEHLGKTTESFAYPFGDLNNSVVSIVKESEYTSARTSYKNKWNGPDTIYLLRSFDAPDSLDKFIKLLN